MQLINEIIENSFLDRITALFPRSSSQLNKLHESDAELIRLPGNGPILAITIDTIVEEIESGLYIDPYLIGWMTVTINASDLAAVGARPLGILLNQIFPVDADYRYIEAVQNGIKDACNEYGFGILGGDTSFSARAQMGSCALGLVSTRKPMTRKGCKPGDHIYTSGALGLGSAYAFCRIFDRNELSGYDINYKPFARVREGQILSKFASCCMDTSDGAIATIDQLTRLNGVGARIESPLERIIDTAAVEICRLSKLPPWVMLAGPHGEFELIFTVPPEKVDDLTTAFRAFICQPIKLGRICIEPGVRVSLGDGSISLPGAKIRNLWTETNGDVNRYIAGLLELNRLIFQEPEGIKSRDRRQADLL